MKVKKSVTLYSKRAKTVAEQLTELYGECKAEIDENSEVVLKQCRQSFKTLRNALRERVSPGSTVDNPALLVEYPEGPKTLELADKNALCQQLLMLVEGYDGAMRYVDTAWIKGFIPIRDHAEHIRSLDGRIFSTAKRIHRRMSEGSRA